jgi:hypothetical protein
MLREKFPVLSKSHYTNSLYTVSTFYFSGCRRAPLQPLGLLASPLLPVTYAVTVASNASCFQHGNPPFA